MRLGFHIFCLLKKSGFITEIRFFFFINYFAQGQLRSYRDLKEVEA